MTTEQLYRLVEDFFGYKCHMRGLNSEKKQVFCVLYDSFWLECDLDDRYGRFGIGIKIGKEEMADLIRHFETDGAALWGEFGTSLWAVVRYLKKKRF